MGRARTKRGRIYQVANWLKDQWPAPCPVEIRIVRATSLSSKDRCFGWCEKRGRRIRITIVDASSWPTAILVDTLIHEWCHALLIQPARWEAKAGLTSEGRERPVELFPHHAAWGATFAAITTAFNDHDPCGADVANDYAEKYRP